MFSTAPTVGAGEQCAAASSRALRVAEICAHRLAIVKRASCALAKCPSPPGKRDRHAVCRSRASCIESPCPSRQIGLLNDGTLLPFRRVGQQTESG